MARLKALKVELQELKSPVHSPGKASEDAGEALSKTKDELKKETVRCEQLQQEKDEATREVAALHAQVEALRRAKSLPSTQEQAASKKLRATASFERRCERGAARELWRRRQRRGRGPFRQSERYAINGDAAHIFCSE